MPAHEHERRFGVFGSEVRLLVGRPSEPTRRQPAIAAIEVEALLRLLHRCLTRFEEASELSALNADPRADVPVSRHLALGVRAAVEAARQSDGLVDPTVIGDLERAGYADSRIGVAPADLREALASAPERHSAAPAARARWREIEVDLEQGWVSRPPGLRIDLGGVGKGLAADLAASRLSDYKSHVVDVGGDVRIGGQAPPARTIEIEHPLTGEPDSGFELVSGAIATSGLRRRVWRRGDEFAHHLIDPGTGLPAWSGVIQATALAPTALRAETIAKAALLSGPARGRELLSENGGGLVLDDGSVELTGPLAAARPWSRIAGAPA